MNSILLINLIPHTKRFNKTGFIIINKKCIKDNIVLYKSSGYPGISKIASQHKVSCFIVPLYSTNQRRRILITHITLLRCVKYKTIVHVVYNNCLYELP